MASLADSLEQAVTDSYCVLTAPAAATAALGEELLKSLPASQGQDGLSAFLRRTRGVRDTFCSQTPIDGADGAPVPFSGGQCPGTNYFIRAQAFRNGDPQGSEQSNTGPGPLELVRQVNPSGTTQSVNLFDANGVSLAGIGSGVQNEIDLQVLEVTPLGGDPNNCGDPGRDVPPYLEPQFTVDLDITFDDTGTGTPVNLQPTAVFAPLSVNVDNEFVIPVKVNFSPEVDVFAELNLSTGGFTFNNNQTFDNSVNVDVFEGPPIEEEPDEETVVIAVTTVATINPAVFSGTELSQGTATPSIFVPRLANLYFVYDDGNGGAVRGRDIPIKSLSQLVYADRAAVSAVIAPEPGVTITGNYVVLRAELLQTYW